MTIKHPLRDRFCLFSLLACLVFQAVMWTVAFKYDKNEIVETWIVAAVVLVGTIYCFVRAHIPFIPKILVNLKNKTFLDKTSVTEDNWIFFSRLHFFNAAESSLMGISMTLIPTDYVGTLQWMLFFAGSLALVGISALLFKKKGFFGNFEFKDC